jgi:hypothetical protein
VASEHKTPMWGGHPLLSDKHVHDLELAAAVNEFHHGHNRAKAEQMALDEYRREHHARAAAHHLQGMRASQASGNHDDAKRHFDMYGLHLKALGHESHEAVPPEVKRYSEGDQAERAYRFKSHGADQFLVNTMSKSEVPGSVLEYFIELTKGDVVQFPGEKVGPGQGVQGVQGPPAPTQTLDGARFNRDMARRMRESMAAEARAKASGKMSANSFRQDLIQRMNAGTATQDEVNALDPNDVWNYLKGLGLPRPTTHGFNPYYLHRVVTNMREGKPGSHEELVDHLRAQGGKEMKAFSLADIPASLRMRTVK